MDDSSTSTSTLKLNDNINKIKHTRTLTKIKQNELLNTTNLSISNNILTLDDDENLIIPSNEYPLTRELSLKSLSSYENNFISTANSSNRSSPILKKWEYKNIHNIDEENYINERRSPVVDTSTLKQKLLDNINGDNTKILTEEEKLILKCEYIQNVNKRSSGRPSPIIKLEKTNFTSSNSSQTSNTPALTLLDVRKRRQSITTNASSLLPSTDNNELIRTISPTVELERKSVAIPPVLKTNKDIIMNKQLSFTTAIGLTIMVILTILIIIRYIYKLVM